MTDIEHLGTKLWCAGTNMAPLGTNLGPVGTNMECGRDQYGAYSDQYWDRQGP